MYCDFQWLVCNIFHIYFAMPAMPAMPVFFDRYRFGSEPSGPRRFTLGKPDLPTMKPVGESFPPKVILAGALRLWVGVEG
jgi:hypothetical protein